MRRAGRPTAASIAVERHRSAPVVRTSCSSTSTSRASRVVASRATVGALVTPAWRPDGRAIVAAADLEDQPFNLYEFALDAPGTRRQLTRTTGGATWPDVSPDGRTIVFVGYTADGFDLFTMPYPASQCCQRGAAGVRPQPGARSDPDWRRCRASRRSDAHSRYSPLADADADVLVAGDRNGQRSDFVWAQRRRRVDVLGYHVYSASATWLASAAGGRHHAARGAPDWRRVRTCYDRWRPTLFASASKHDLVFRRAADRTRRADAPPRCASAQIEAGVLLPFHHVRVARISALVSMVRRRRRLHASPDDAVARPDRRPCRLGGRSATAHTYGYSISPEARRRAWRDAKRCAEPLGSFGRRHDADRRRARLSSRASRPITCSRFAWPAAYRLATRPCGRTFLLGGADPGTSVIDFGRNAISLLRGFPADTFAGTHVALVNADYRLPLARPAARRRHVAALPAHRARRARSPTPGTPGPTRFARTTSRRLVGGELSADLVAGYSFPFTATVGAAWGHDGARRMSPIARRPSISPSDRPIVLTGLPSLL